MGEKTENFLQAALLANLQEQKLPARDCAALEPQKSYWGSVQCHHTSLAPLILYQEEEEESFPLKLYIRKSAYYSIKIVTVLLGGKGSRQPSYKYCMGAINNFRNKQVLQTRNLLAVAPTAEPATALILLVHSFILSEPNASPWGSTSGLDGAKY